MLRLYLKVWILSCNLISDKYKFYFFFNPLVFYLFFLTISVVQASRKMLIEAVIRAIRQTAQRSHLEHEQGEGQRQGPHCQCRRARCGAQTHEHEMVTWAEWRVQCSTDWAPQAPPVSLYFLCEQEICSYILSCWKFWACSYSISCPN